MSWEWDSSLYRGSAEYYATGRMPYPATVAEVLREALGLDGTGEYLDVGCGPGSLTMLLAPMFARTTGVDADGDMIQVAARRATQHGLPDIEWRHVRAEDLPDGLGPQRLITFAQSFHWMDRPRVAAIARGMLADGGAVVHVHANTHEGVEGSTTPYGEIAALVTRYLGPTRRAGQGSLPQGTPGGEAAIYAAAGFAGPERIVIERDEAIERTEDEVVAAVFSLSSSAPHLFGDRAGAFERDLRELLRATSPTGVFIERPRDIALDVWR